MKDGKKKAELFVSMAFQDVNDSGQIEEKKGDPV